MATVSRRIGLGPGEIVAIVGGVVLLVSVFLAWYHIDNANGVINGRHGPDVDVTLFQASPVWRWLVIAACVAPIVLGYIAVRGNALSWPRGEMTAVIGVIALVIVIFKGVLAQPGSPSGEITVAYGFFIALAAALAMVLGAAVRSSRSRRPKPPGAL
jgi:hypothetical protein